MSKRARLKPLRVSDGFRSFVLDQLEELGDVTPKPMFGGVGLYCRGVFFGILAADVLYLKVDETNITDFKRAHSKPFRPYADRSGAMQYWAVPLGVLESPLELAAWARKAVAVARRVGDVRVRPRITKSGVKRRYGRRKAQMPRRDD